MDGSLGRQALKARAKVIGSPRSPYGSTASAPSMKAPRVTRALGADDPAHGSTLGAAGT
jgi:hypothetical protein